MSVVHTFLGAAVAAFLGAAAFLVAEAGLTFCHKEA